MKLTRKIEFTFEENMILGNALYFAILLTDEWLKDFEDDKDCIIYKSACEYREGFVHLMNRLYPERLGGEADE